MATVMQSYVRRIFAEKERRKRWARHLQILRNDSATEIQRVYRGHMCKVQAQVLTEEKRQRLEAEEKAKIKSRKHDCAVVIQKHARRIQARTSCRDKRIEMRLHERLLMYTGRKRLAFVLLSFANTRVSVHRALHGGRGFPRLRKVHQ